MLEKRPRVVFLEVLDQALLLLHRQGGAAGDVLDELLEALRGGLLPLALIFLQRHLLAEPEHCNNNDRRS